jgi:hypothetical protein
MGATVRNAGSYIEGLNILMLLSLFHMFNILMLLSRTSNRKTSNRIYYFNIQAKPTQPKERK